MGDSRNQPIRRGHLDPASRLRRKNPHQTTRPRQRHPTPHAMISPLSWYCGALYRSTCTESATSPDNSMATRCQPWCGLDGSTRNIADRMDRWIAGYVYYTRIHASKREGSQPSGVNSVLCHDWPPRKGMVAARQPATVYTSPDRQGYKQT